MLISIPSAQVCDASGAALCNAAGSKKSPSHWKDFVFKENV